MESFEQVIADMRGGVERSVRLHGDWEGYPVWRVLWVVLGEFREVVWAAIRFDLHGPHGVVSELRDLAIVAVKGVTVLSRRRV